MHSLEQLRNGELIGTKRLQIAAELTEFPDEIFTLADSLEILDLSHNRLSNLPNDLAKLHKLKIIFCSNNDFEHLPVALGTCSKLEMIGFKSNRIKYVDEQSLPIQTRWLILTDNQIESLPDKMGQLSRLQKLALAGNKLTYLPDSMRQCKNLELVRLSANQLDAFPALLFSLPKLAWLSFSGNPFSNTEQDHPPVKTINMNDLQLHEILGQGASGVISRASWQQDNFGFAEEVAIKVFKGQVTSDGYPADELRTYLATGLHENLVKPLAYIDEENCLALVMELIPSHYDNLGQPPDLNTCTRDTFTTGQAFNMQQVDRILLQMQSLLSHLEGRQISHGDLYAHNVLIDAEQHILFGDFGAASHYEMLTPAEQQGIQKIERRAFAYFIEDMLSLCEDHSSSPSSCELYLEWMHTSQQLLGV